MFLVLCALVIAGCSKAQPATPTLPSISADAIQTAAAQTADARLTQLPTAVPQTPTPTPDLTQTAAIAQTATQVAQVTATPTPTLGPTVTPAVVGEDNAVYVKDVTIPDGTILAAGTKFTKTWQLINRGNTTWNTSYELVFVSGDQMGGPASVRMVLDVPAGQVVDVSVELVAPAANGTYKGFWRMRNPAGVFFGDSVYLQIVVGTPVTLTPTVSGPTPTAGPAVSEPAISVDTADFTGACPHTFKFTVSFKINSNATITYQLEAGGFSLTLPGPQTETLSPGLYTRVYELGITSSGSGWARLHITAPSDLTSSQVNFSLTCSP
jgi:hypothetical protein